MRRSRRFWGWFVIAIVLVVAAYLKDLNHGECDDCGAGANGTTLENLWVRWLAIVWIALGFLVAARAKWSRRT